MSECVCVPACEEGGGINLETTVSVRGRDMFIREQKHMLSMMLPCLSISYLNIKAH